MADPLTLGLLGGVVATEGIKFLYGQASELLKAWRARKPEKVVQPTPPDDLEVPILSSTALDREPVARPADAEVMRETRGQLLSLATTLSPFALGQSDVDLRDADLAEASGRLRELLELIYHQRFTFLGESRDPTGSAVLVRQRLGTVKGRAVGAEADVNLGGALEVDQSIDSVDDGGEVTGFAGRIGG
jgi:hypothetical protein